MKLNIDNIEMKKSIKLSKVLQRELKGKNISNVAKEIGIGISLLHDWHSSSRTPSAKNMVQLKRVADYLGLTLEEILFDESIDREILCTTTFSDRIDVLQTQHVYLLASNANKT